MRTIRPECGRGPLSAHFTAIKKELSNVRRVEPQTNIKRWIDEYIAELDNQIEIAKIEEERLGEQQ